MKVDTDLVIKASNGDKDAFSDFYYYCYGDLYNYAFYYLRNADDASDVVSDTFVEIWKGIGKLRVPEAFAAWAFRILTIRCKKEISGRFKRYGEYNFEDFSDNFFASSDNMEENIVERVTLAAALSKLGEKDRMMVLLSAVYGYKQREIAKIIGKPRGTVGSRLHKIYSVLRKELMKK